LRSKFLEPKLLGENSIPFDQRLERHAAFRIFLAGIVGVAQCAIKVEMFVL
jgi:hypothetical protein